MKKYVILTMSIEGVTGNPRYVNNKCGWLKQQGWEPIVIWSLDQTKIELEHTKPFGEKRFIFHELNYFPSWFTPKKRDAVVDRIIKVIGTADKVVLETNKIQLSAWGELIARRINVKHISFITTERLKIHNHNTFDYCYGKLNRGEFFTINKAAVKFLFSNFIDIAEPEKYYWSASGGVEVREYHFPAFDDLPKADYTITHFGRTKGYFPYMIDELNSFISQHPDKHFNLFFLGNIKNVEEIKTRLSMKNVSLAFHPAVLILPAQVFFGSDAVIATAGCASLSSKNGGMTISMDINNNKPLGLLRYTTLDSNTCSGKYHNDKSLSEWLEELLFKKTNFTKLDEDNVPHSFEYQMKYFTDPDGQYFDTTKIGERITRNDWFWASLARIGLFRLVDYVFFLKIRIKRKFRK